MRRFIGSKLTIVVLVLAVITLITGVTWAANSSTSSSSPGNQLTSSVVEVVAIPVTVEVGGKLEIAGAGFKSGEAVLFEVVLGGGADRLILKSGLANDAGAFLSTNAKLSGIVTPGIYTITATTPSANPVATTPLIVIEVVK